MSANDKLTAQFGMITISMDARDVLRRMALQELGAEVPSLGSWPIAMPTIGTFWEAEGGIYCGRLIDDDDRAYALVVAPRVSEFSNIAWDDAKKKAAALDVNGQNDWGLPNRMEALAMWQRLHPLVKGTDEAFAEEVYWTSEQHAVYSGNAWDQGFGYGSQGYWHKAGNGRARAVRRVVIQ